MEEKILEAICILPRIELLNRYLEEEIDQLEKNPAGDNLGKICQRIRELNLMSEDISKKVFKDVNIILGYI